MNTEELARKLESFIEHFSVITPCTRCGIESRCMPHGDGGKYVCQICAAQDPECGRAAVKHFNAAMRRMAALN